MYVDSIHHLRCAVVRHFTELTAVFLRKYVTDV